LFGIGIGTGRYMIGMYMSLHIDIGMCIGMGIWIGICMGIGIGYVYVWL